MDNSGTSMKKNHSLQKMILCASETDFSAARFVLNLLINKKKKKKKNLIGEKPRACNIYILWLCDLLKVYYIYSQKFPQLFIKSLAVQHSERTYPE